MSKGQSAMEYLMTYGWVFLILVIAGAAMYAMGIIKQGAYVKEGCVGFGKMQYEDHRFKAIGADGTFDVGDDDRESMFSISFTNGYTSLIHVTELRVEYPDDVWAEWSVKGVSCDNYNTPGDTTSGCARTSLGEAQKFELHLEDAGGGLIEMVRGDVYSVQVEIIFDREGTFDDHSTTGTCSGTIE